MPSSLSPEMQDLIDQFSLGAVATVDADGRPAVSPKGTFIVIDDCHLAFGNIRSPKTIANLKRQADVEVLFTDVLTRKALRVRGQAEVLASSDVPGDGALHQHLVAKWDNYVDLMQDIVVISIEAAEIVTSPAYDLGHTAEELKATYIQQFSAMG